MGCTSLRVTPSTVVSAAALRRKFPPPQINETVITGIETIKTRFANLILWLPRIAGALATSTVIKLRPKTPVIETNWIIPSENVHTLPRRFQGNPVNKFPLRNSKIEKIKEKNKTKEILLSTKGPAIRIARPKNKDKNRGINIKAKGMKPLNNSS